MAQMVRNPPVMQETKVQSLGQQDPLEGAWQPTPVFLPAESHGQGSLAVTVHGVTSLVQLPDAEGFSTSPFCW